MNHIIEGGSIQLIVDSGELVVNSWQIKSLEDICENLDSQRVPITKSKRKPGSIPYYGASGVVDYVDDYLFDEDLLLVSEDGANLLARTYPIAFSISGKTWVNNHAHVLKFADRSTQTFVEYYLNSISLEPYISGAAQPKLNQRKLNSIPIPLPPLEEQRRIVAILDEAFEGIDRAIANTKQNLANAREIFDSYLNSIFTQKGDDWVEKKLGDTEVLRIIDGDRGKNYPKKADFYPEGYCLFLNTKNVRPDGFNFDTTMFITEEKDKALRKGKLMRRDVILTTRGTIGNIALYDDSVEFDHIRINSGMLIFRPNEKVITSEYLFEVMRSSIVKLQIKRFTSGAAQPQLPIKTLVNFSFPIPTQLEDQNRIVENLHQLSDETQRLEAIYQQKLEALHELKQSILHKAFTGELTNPSASLRVNPTKEAAA
ncbi:restriction endonuclease subunit S [Roseofilum sp. BLCC_M154]|uniref:Restriction endonuclease subunit S n=1 Tax=Roseofilum acuticapitatum BLCC-M154 TaxID=3022444 RepID=A0ABT7AYG3_9CYAN|nr:restriction endonuclease subunit S [Roseofilum acuticapitatum]MDJ1171926.1 restriction endonuclease subunit S [Roseofilum acuticapitatum BLCC-M154]